MRNALLLSFFYVLIATTALSQGTMRKVHGTLLDPLTGDPLPGVNVVVKGTTTGTTTDARGFYELTAPEDGTLVFSFVGFQTKEVPVAAVLRTMGEPATGETAAEPVKVFRHTIEGDPDKTLSPYFFVQSDDPSTDQLPLKSTTTRVNIAGVIADVRVEQVYINTGKTNIEAMYIFPGSTQAAVYGMNMRIGKRTLMARIKEKQEARREYEEAREVGKTATLLEQQRPNVFQMNVANILPGDTINVSLQYTELLVPAEGTYEFVYPTVVGPRYSETPDDQAHGGDQWVKSLYTPEGVPPGYDFRFLAQLNSAIPIKQVTSSSHKVDVQFMDPHRAIIQMDTSEADGGNRDVIIRYRLRGNNVQSGVLLYPHNDENFFLLMVEPPDKPTLDQIPGREYIFVIDVSGSMSGFPLDVAKEFLRSLITSLRPSDKFNVMLFESSNAMLYKRSVDATRENITEAMRVIDQRGGGGGTRLLPALQKALAHPKDDGYARTFVVVTDGYVTVEKEAMGLIRNNLNHANLFAVGIGSSVNRYLIEGLARAGMAEPFVVTNEKEAREVGHKFKKVVEAPVLTSIKIDYGDFRVYDIEPVSIPDVFAERPVIVFGKYTGNASGTITLTGVNGSDTYQKSMNLAEANRDQNQALRYLWARNKIKLLDDYGQLDRGDLDAAEKVRQQVTALGLRYNLLTQYTSFVAVDSVVRNTGPANKIQQPLPLPAGVSNLAVGLAGLTLSYDVTQLSEVVVCCYGVQVKRTVVYSATNVQASGLAAGTYSAAQNLMGRVAGVTVYQNSGSPGSASQVMIRGAGSMLAGNQPMYVVDGVLVEGTPQVNGITMSGNSDPMSSIRPDEISSIEILKSGAATSLYGARAANGAIVITTRKAQSGKLTVDFSTSIAVDRVNKLPALQNQYAQGRPTPSGLTWFGGDSNELFSWGPRIDGLNFDGSDYAYDRSGKLVPAAGVGNAKTYDPYSFFRNGVTSHNSLFIGKRTVKSDFSSTVGYTHQSGVTPGADLSRWTGAISYQRTIKDKLTLTARVRLAQVQQTLPLSGNSTSSLMYGLLTSPATFDTGNGMRGNTALHNVTSYRLGDGTPRSYASTFADNPYWTMAWNASETESRSILSTFSAKYELADFLSASFTLTGDFGNDQLTNRLDKYSSAYPGGMFTNRQESANRWQTSLILEHQEQLANGDISLSGLAGLNTFHTERLIERMEGYGLQQSGVFDESNATTMLHQTKAYNNERYQVMSSLTARYKHFISVTLTGSADKLSTLPDRGWLPGGHAGFAFNVGDLPNATLPLWLNAAKLFGSVGAMPVEAPLYIDPAYQQALLYDVADPILYAERIPLPRNNGVSPEMAHDREAGVELELLQNQVEMGLSVYTREYHNAYTPVSAPSGFQLASGTTWRNRGVEISLAATPLQGAVHWRATITFTRARTKVTSLPDGYDRIALAGFQSMSSNLVKGEPYGVLVGTRYLRDEQGRQVIGDDGFPLVDSTPGVIGDPNPDWSLGWNNEWNFKGVSLEALLDIRHGGDRWNGTAGAMNYFGTSAASAALRNTEGYVFDGVTTAGESNTRPVDFAPATGDVYNNRWTRYGLAGVGEAAIEDASWVRLRYLAIGYTLPGNLFGRRGLKKVQVKVFANNLWLRTRYAGVDPETSMPSAPSSLGLDYFNLPGTRTVGLSLKAGF